MNKLGLIALVLGMCLMFTSCVQTTTLEGEGEVRVPGVGRVLFEQADFARVDGALVTTSLSEVFAENIFGLRASGGELEPVGIESGADLVQHNGREEALISLIAGNSDIIFIAMPTEQEIEAARQTAYERAVAAIPYGAELDVSFDAELEFIPVAKDALVFFAGRGNPVNNLSEEQIQDIYSGEITKWSVIDPAIANRGDWEIRAFQQDASSDSLREMKILMDLRSADLQSADSRSAGDDGRLVLPFRDFFVNSGGETVVLGISKFDSAMDSLGFSMFSYVNRMFVKDRMKLLSVNEVMPDAETIKSDEYGTVVTYYAVVRRDAEAESFARRLLAFAVSDEGQRAAEQAGYVGVR